MPKDHLDILLLAVQWAVLGLPLMGALLMGWGLLTGRIQTRGMLCHADGRPDPQRLQMLLFTLLLAGYCLRLIGEQGAAGFLHDGDDMLSDLVVLTMGGSHGLYLLEQFRKKGG